MEMIDIQHLSKDYGDGKGVFDITLQVKQKEIYGYLGANGAGKSTTMRHLMGFSKPQAGNASICGLDCWKQQKKIQQLVGYLPGEIAFPDDMNGLAYLRLIAKMRGIKDMKRTYELLELFELDADTGIKRMSKGMKQKIGIVAAFLHDPQILLLDEPTSGLDPLMQNRFIALLEQEKAKGKTILLSSHIFEEVEKTCDRVGLIRQGKLIQQVSIDELRHSQRKTYKIAFHDKESLKRMQKAYPAATYHIPNSQVILTIQDDEVNALLHVLAACDVAYLKEEKHTLEEYFMQFYGGDRHA